MNVCMYVLVSALAVTPCDLEICSFFSKSTAVILVQATIISHLDFSPGFITRN